MTDAEDALRHALEAVRHERRTARAPASYWYPLSAVSYGTDELMAVCDALCDEQTTMGPRVRAFEERFAAVNQSRHAVMVNSGSSADLVAAFALVDPRNPRLAPGDEVLAPAVTWPTQIDSLLMAGFAVRLVDVDPITLQMDLADLEAKIGPRTTALSLVHLMGNPCDMDRVTQICRRHDLVLLEDCCEALGASWAGRPVGSFGFAGTYSFFFSHHITTMEGGMIVTQDDDVAETLRLLRAHGWSRAASAATAASASADGVDQRYKFLTWGFNVRPTEVEGAFGLVQADRVEGFAQMRRRNALALIEALAPLDDRARVMEVTPGGTCSWFALPVILAADCRVDAATVMASLERSGIETRPIVAGNLARQPMTSLFPQLTSGELPGAEAIHQRGFYIGIHPSTEVDADRVGAAFRVAFGQE